MHTKMMLITANVGSVFEDLERLLPVWLDEISKAILVSQCSFVAIHLQEMGGKNYRNTMHLVSTFVKSITESQPLVDHFDRSVAFVDDQFSQENSFTALGSVYLLHHRLSSAKIFNWKDESYSPIVGSLFHCGNLLNIDYCEKHKFPLEYFPDCKWSRKGFLRTRWRLGSNRLDLVNIHLFHDACNISALKSPISDYCLFRQRALRYTLDILGHVPFCLFGDFNFRVNTQAVVRRLTDGLCHTEVRDSESVSQSSDAELTYCDNDRSVVLRVGKKHFQHSSHQHLFLTDVDWLREYDFELDEFSSVLHEFPVCFPPSYPFEEDVTRPCIFMHTRCPSWCDRVLLSKMALNLVQQKDVHDVEYKMIGKDICTGDHKPVSLVLRVRTSRYKCASPTRFSRQRSRKCYQVELIGAASTSVVSNATPSRINRWARVLRSRRHAVAR